METLSLFDYAYNREMTKRLRPYQINAIGALLADIDAGEHPVCAMATGSGKSLIITALCGELKGRVLVATHRKELIEQNSQTLAGWLPDADYGIYSAGLSQRETDSRVIFGGIQSIYRRMSELQRAGAFSAVLVDEAHRTAPSNVESMYKTVFDACPGAVRVGFSATPYRLDDGPIYGDEHTWFTTMPCHIGVEELTQQGYLSPLVGVLTAADVPLDGVRKQAGEFVLSDLSQAATEEAVARLAVSEICDLASHRASWLVFCVDVEHTYLITRMLQNEGILARAIVGDTPADERAEVLEAFRSGKIRALVNCMVGTEGFDIPCVDCVALLRPTMSKSLVVQMIGRGTRLYESKDSCLVLDLAGNLERHVPLDGLPEPVKSPRLEKREKQEQEQAERERKEREARHGYQASRVDPRYAQELPPRVVRVVRVAATLSPSKKYADLMNLRIQYLCEDEGGKKLWVNQWLCPEYQGWAKEQARLWFARRGLRMPTRASEAVGAANSARRPMSILVEKSRGFDRIKMEYFDMD